LPLLLDAASFLALVVAGFAVRTRRGKKTEKSIKTGVKYRFPG